MYKFKVRAHYIVSARNYVRCRVCSRRPKAHRNMYEITSTFLDRGFTSTAHHGYMDTKKCAEMYVIKEMGT